MSHDRITQLRISGLRTLADVKLDLRGLTVLIGDNGTGKSSILEALEILRHAAKPLEHIPDIFMRRHGGPGALLGGGADLLRLGVTIEGEDFHVDYDFEVGLVGTSLAVLHESVLSFDPHATAPRVSMTRNRGFLKVSDPQSEPWPSEVRQEVLKEFARPVGEQSLILPKLGFGHEPLLQRVIDALSRIDLQVPFETRPLWQQKELDVREGPRHPSSLEPADRLGRYGINLTNAYQQLQSLGNGVWNRVLQRAQLGLGADLRSFRLRAVGRGELELALEFAAFPDKLLPAYTLSEGQLAYLAFIALCELHPKRSLLAFDEPELHLNPALLARVVGMLEGVAKESPVIIATHSDRFLDALEDPASSIVLCDLDSQRRTRLRRPDPALLADWLTDYRGYGSIRAEGYESHVFDHGGPAHAGSQE
jgi:predicted ATPase